jgi:ribosomal-protein-alanine N-acetyltransferase
VHYDVARFKSIEIADRLIAYFDAQFDSNTGIRWAIRSRKLSEFLGTCGFTHWNEFVYSAVVGKSCIKTIGAKTIGAKAIQLNRWGPLSILFLVRVFISM